MEKKIQMIIDTLENVQKEILLARYKKENIIIEPKMYMVHDIDDIIITLDKLLYKERTKNE